MSIRHFDVKPHIWKCACQFQCFNWKHYPVSMENPWCVRRCVTNCTFLTFVYSFHMNVHSISTNQIENRQQEPHKKCLRFCTEIVNCSLFIRKLSMENGFEFQFPLRFHYWMSFLIENRSISNFTLSHFKSKSRCGFVM